MFIVSYLEQPLIDAGTIEVIRSEVTSIDFVCITVMAFWKFPAYVRIVCEVSNIY